MEAVGGNSTKSSHRNLTNASCCQRPNFMGSRKTSILRDSFLFYFKAKNS